MWRDMWRNIAKEGKHWRVRGDARNQCLKPTEYKNKKVPSDFPGEAYNLRAFMAVESLRYIVFPLHGQPTNRPTDLIWYMVGGWWWGWPRRSAFYIYYIVKSNNKIRWETQEWSAATFSSSLSFRGLLAMTDRRRWRRSKRTTERRSASSRSIFIVDVVIIIISIVTSMDINAQDVAREEGVALRDLPLGRRKLWMMKDRQITVSPLTHSLILPIHQHQHQHGQPIGDNWWWS